MSSVVRVCGPSDVITVNFASGSRSPTLIAISVSTRVVALSRANLWLWRPRVEMEREFDRSGAGQRETNGLIGKRPVFWVLGESDEESFSFPPRLEEIELWRLGKEILRRRAPPPDQSPARLFRAWNRSNCDLPRDLFRRKRSRHGRFGGRECARLVCVFRGQGELQAGPHRQADFLARRIIEFEDESDRLAALLRDNTDIGRASCRERE